MESGWLCVGIIFYRIVRINRRKTISFACYLINYKQDGEAYARMLAGCRYTSHKINMKSEIDFKLAGLCSDSGYALQLLVLAILIVIVIATSTRWRGKKKPAYQRRTSQASAMGANRQLLEEISGMKQNVINVSCL